MNHLLQLSASDNQYMIFPNLITKFDKQSSTKKNYDSISTEDSIQDRRDLHGNIKMNESHRIMGMWVVAFLRTQITISVEP
jgi:hypothetical protein